MKVLECRRYHHMIVNSFYKHTTMRINGYSVNNSSIVRDCTRIVWYANGVLQYKAYCANDLAIIALAVKFKSSYDDFIKWCDTHAIRIINKGLI